MYKNFGSIYRLTLAGPQRPRHIIQENSLHLSPGEGGWGSKELGGGDLLILRGNGGGIGRGQQSVKGGNMETLFPINCQEWWWWWWCGGGGGVIGIF